MWEILVRPWQYRQYRFRRPWYHIVVTGNSSVEWSALIVEADVWYWYMMEHHDSGCMCLIVYSEASWQWWQITIVCGGAPWYWQQVITWQCAVLHCTLLDIFFHYHGAPLYTNMVLHRTPSLPTATTMVLQCTLLLPAAIIIVLYCALSLPTATMMMLRHTLSLPPPLSVPTLHYVHIIRSTTWYLVFPYFYLTL